MRNLIRSAIVLVAAAGLLAPVGCNETVKNPEESEFEKLPEWKDPRPEAQKSKDPQELNERVFLDAATVDQLANRDDDPATVIDARTLESYNEGHYPGAVHSGNTSDYKPFKDPDYNDVLPRNVQDLQEEARGMGVFDDRPVIIYAKGGSKRAGRLHWALEYLGHGDAYIYNPGYEDLIDETGADPSTEATNKSGDFVVRRRPEVYATTEEVDAIASGENDDGILIDVRRESEFTGEEKRAPRHGYIPEAQYYFWKNVYNDDGELRDKSELQDELEDAGLLDDDKMLVPYCQTGTRSGYFYSVLRWLGAEKVANYDSSWTRWARRSDTQVAQDGEQRLDSSN